MRLWPKAIVRKIRFYDLRHTTASLFLMSGVPLEVVQKVLRHTDPKVTSEIYGHLLMEYQRTAIGKARLLAGERSLRRRDRAAASRRRLLTVC